MAALVGIPPTMIQTEIAAVFNVHFDTAIQRAWKQSNWIDLCPYGEARFVGNQTYYPNDLTKTTYWTATNVTATYAPAQVPNPADGRLTVSKLLETVANGAHNVAQSTTFLPSTKYRVSAYVRPNGRNYAILSVNDGVTTHTASFQLVGATVVSKTNCTANIGSQASGFYLCVMEFDSDVAAGSGSLTISLSTDGTTTSYAGTTTLGIYVWGALVVQASNTGQDSALLPWDQVGEREIEAVFEVWQTNPTSSTYPTVQGYLETSGGIQMVTGYQSNYYVNGVAQNQVFGTPPLNPCFIFYRRQCPSYTGSEFDATDTYTVDEQVYFVNSIGVGNFYKCLATTTAGQDPDDTPSKWELIEIPEILFWYALYQSFADWLISDGQQDKAVGMYAIATEKLQDEFDRQERQMSSILPWQVSTHLTSPTRF